MYEYRAIIHRLRAGLSDREIAREGLSGRPKVQAIRQRCEEQGWLNADAQLPSDEELATLFRIKHAACSQSKSNIHREFIQEAVLQGIQGKVIHQRLVEQFNFQGSYCSVQRLIKIIKANDLSDLTVPLFFAPGEAAQVDFGKGVRLYDLRIEQEVETWFFVMTLCWSRHQYAEIVTHQDIETWLRCHENAWTWFGGVTAKVIIDNAKCAITRACYYDPQLQRSYESFAQEYGFVISACAPRDPQKKGRVESGVKYIKNNFFPLRSFVNLQQANIALKQWIRETAGKRVHGSTFEQPLKKFEEERGYLKALPAALPEIAVWQKVRMYRNCHVCYQYCYYSVPFDLYHKELWLKATPATITIYHDHCCVAHHARYFKKGSYQTIQAHLPPNARYYLKRDSAWCRERSAKIGDSCATVIKTLLEDKARDLLRQAQGILALESQYDRLSLENACRYAIEHQCLNYRTIKTVLEKRLEEVRALDAREEEVSRAVYQGGARFQRDATEFKH